jgi:UDP-hydrolysing UDP-N-acetyl-D-glucosamine 2-epimerase
VRTVAIFTGTRADYGLLRSVLHVLEIFEDCKYRLIVGGAHITQEFGHTLDEITADGFTPAATLSLSQDDTGDICRIMGEVLIGMGQIFERRRPDIVLLLGDRYETFCAAAAAQALRIPIAHIHGGETTEGAMDESFRHAVSKMSHLHFASCEIHRRRIIQLGEHPDRVFNVGSLGVENIFTLPLMCEAEARAALDLPLDIPYIVCTLHPTTLESTQIVEQISGLLEALSFFPDHAVVFTGANVDPGGEIINKILREHVKNTPLHRFFISLGQKRYFSAVKYAACIIGNSSSGIIEVPSFGKPVVDIGNRQRGRIRSEAIVHSEQKKEAVIAAVRTALSSEMSRIAATTPNPYHGDGTAEKIAEIVRSYPLERIQQKKFFDIIP